MIAPTTDRRTKSNIRSSASMPLTRSGSILGTIKNIVSAPLLWFASSENLEDLGKRRRIEEREAESDDGDRHQQKAKRMRIDSPERGSTRAGYLDPPASSFHHALPEARSVNASFGRKMSGIESFNRGSSVFGISSTSMRTMSMDPPAQYATYHRDPMTVPLPIDSPMESAHSMSVGPRDLSMQPPTSPFRLRTSLTPQPSPAKPIRREVSAPPPLSSLMSKPVFVKPPTSDTSGRELREQKTMSLGSFAEFNRITRSPSRDRMLTSFGSLSTVPSQMSISSSANAHLQSAAEKVFHELEMYKTPIIPSRYKGSKAIPEFLKPKRVHVPIPMTKKEREAKPSLGMAAKANSKGKEKDEGKPYAGRSGLSKLLAKRKAEEEGRRGPLAYVEDADEEEEVNGGKRDVAVSAKLTSGSESESSRKRKVAEVVDVPAVEDPFDKPPRTVGGRQQPYGRVGRSRVRETGVRSVFPGGTGRGKTNKFSADFEEDDSVDDINMEDDGAEQATEPEGKKPVFDAPAGFTFAATSTPIQHDHAGAKDPPISSLPFSFGNSATNDLSSKPATSSESFLNAKADVVPTTATPSFFSLATPAKSAESTVLRDRPEPKFEPPKLAVVPPTPEQMSTSARQQAPAPSDFFATPSTSNSVATSSSPAPASVGVPNFFANSAFLASSKPVAVPSLFGGPAAPSVPDSSAVPTKDVENPLWNGDVRPVAAKTPTNALLIDAQAPKIERPRSAEPKPSPFGGFNKPSSWGQPAKSSEPSPAPAPSTFFSIPPGQSEALTSAAAATPILTENRPASVPIQFGTKPTSPPTAPTSFAPSVSGTTGSVSPSGQPANTPFFSPAPLASAPGPSNAALDIKPSTSSPSPSPSPFFSFGAPSVASTTTNLDTNTPKPLFGSGPGLNAPSFSTPQPSQGNGAETKSASTFGAPSLADAKSNTSTSSADSTTPKPVLGGTGFTFGASTTSATTAPDTAKNPFAFGAPPATPPSGTERRDSFTAFSATTRSSSTGFNFGTPTKSNEAASTTPVANSSPFAFGALTARSVTPPQAADDNGMRMEESPTRDMSLNGAEKSDENKPVASLSFGSGPTPSNPFAPSGGSTSMFAFGASASTQATASNPFAAKPEDKTSSAFAFGRVASAPVISTTFSFGQKSEGSNTPPATAFGTQPNAFGQTSSSAPFTFGASSTTPTTANAPNPFAAPAQATNSAPGSPFLQNASFSFGAPSSAPFAFGPSQPSSPAGSSSGLPQSPATTNAPFTFGQPNGSSGSTLFNIGAPPPATAGPPGARPLKKLPRRNQTKR